MALFSGESLSALEASSTDHIHLKTGDVECCFCQYSLPEHHRVYFGIPFIKAMHLPDKLRASFPGHGDHDEIRFRARVVPMGWSWAVALIQRGEEHLLGHCGAQAPMGTCS